MLYLGDLQVGDRLEKFDEYVYLVNNGMFANVHGINCDVCEVVDVTEGTHCGTAGYYREGPEASVPPMSTKNPHFGITGHYESGTTAYNYAVYFKVVS